LVSLRKYVSLVRGLSYAVSSGAEL
jgi:hypothetical protein